MAAVVAEDLLYRMHSFEQPLLLRIRKLCQHSSNFLARSPVERQEDLSALIGQREQNAPPIGARWRGRNPAALSESL